MLVHWQWASSILEQDDNLTHGESFWDKRPIDKVISDPITTLTDLHHRARFKAVSAPHSGDWVFALSIADDVQSLIHGPSSDQIHLVERISCVSRDLLFCMKTN